MKKTPTGQLQDPNTLLPANVDTEVRTAGELAMSRRNLLQRGGALAMAAPIGIGAAALTGSSGEEAAAGVHSEIGAYVIPTSLVTLLPVRDSQGNIINWKDQEYQVEVIFGTTAAVTVQYINFVAPNQVSYKLFLASKAATMSDGHKVGLGLYRVHTGTDYPYQTADRLRLIVTESGQNSILAGSGAGTDGGSVVQYNLYPSNGSGAEHEWNFYSRLNGSLLVTVRFFEILTGKPTWRTGEFFRVITNNATHENQNTLTRHLVESLPGTGARTQLEAIRDVTTNNNDTICYPNKRRLNDKNELWPCYIGASAEVKPLLTRRMQRHLESYALDLALAYKGYTDPEDMARAQQSIANESLTAVGGKGISEHLKKTTDGITNSAKTATLDGSGFTAFCDTYLKPLADDTMRDATKRALDNTLPDPDYSLNKIAAGVGASHSVQMGASLVIKDYFNIPGFSPGGGFRLSFGLHRASRKYHVSDGWKASAYNILTDTTSQGYTLGVTGIVKGFNSADIFSIKGVAIDIEVTVNLSKIAGKNWRLDLITFDPVFDLDTRTLIGGLIEKGLTKLMSSAIKLRELAAPTNLANVVYATADGRLFNSLATGDTRMLLGYVTADLKSTLQSAANASGARTYATREFSPIRLAFPHKYVNDPSPPAVMPFYEPASVVWMPAVKFICGAGFAHSGSTTPVPPSTTGIAYTGFVRRVVCLDGWLAFGGPVGVRSVGYKWTL